MTKNTNRFGVFERIDINLSIDGINVNVEKDYDSVI